jgi:Xaa-Pro aminopeptidase
METLFSNEFFANNRQKLRQLFVGTAPIVLSSNGMLQKGGDNPFPFNQDASFWYLTGINEPDILLVMDKGKEYLIVPNRSHSREIFDGQVDFEDLKARSGIAEVLTEEEGWSRFSSRLKKVKHLATLGTLPEYIESYGFYTNPSRMNLVRKIKELNSDIELLDISMHIVRLRMIKQPEEIQAIEKAIEITGSTMNKALSSKRLGKYQYEYEIEAELTRGYRLLGADGHAFAPIVASGVNAVTLHNVSNNSQIKSGSLIVVDTGAEYEHYAADITRTYAANNTTTKRAQKVYQAVIEAQEFGFSRLKPGVLLRNYEVEMEQYVGEKLRELGLIKNITREEVRRYYPHAASHYMGLNVHDSGDYDKLLEPGNVVTVEPGIYIKEEAIGVRIEDDVLITINGIRNLSSKLPKTLNID